MITAGNLAKIMDFGISKSVGSMTSSGQVLGTPNYMSPEQVKGSPLDGRADLFSFGVVLYEMATGERPFVGDNVTTIIYKIVHEQPIPPDTLEATVPPGLSAVITRCLAKSPNDRYQTGADLARDMENYRSLVCEGESTAVITSTVHSTSSVQNTRPSTASAQGTGTQAAVAVALESSASGKAQTRVATQIALQPAPSQPKIVARSWVLLAVAVVVAAATLYGLKHRHPKLPPQPVVVIQAPAAPALPPASAEASNEQTARTETPPPSKPKVVAARKLTSAKTAPAPVPDTKAAVPSNPEIRFSSNPEGANVAIDGKSEDRWTTPFAVSLTPGTHEVVFAKDGYSRETRQLEVGTRSAPYSINLAPATTALSVTSDPPGANIEVDGNDTGKVTPAEIPVAPGQHRVVLHLDGFHTVPAMANVGAGQVFRLSPVLNPGDAKQAGNANPVTARLGKLFGRGIPGGKGVIDFVTTPPGAKIFIQGKPAAFATPAHAYFPAGDYQIEFREAGYKPLHQTVHVEAGQIRKVDVTLDPQ
jgi:serine/threonine-protein kinase